VDRDGLLKLPDLEDAITDETAVVSLMWANNETGVLFPVKEIAEICRAHGVLFHCDAVRAALDNAELGIMNDEWAALLTSEFCLLTSSFPRCAGVFWFSVNWKKRVERLANFGG
jgi:kynureninase